MNSLRLERLRQCAGDSSLRIQIDSAIQPSDQPLTTIVSSRLGQRVELHRRVGQFLVDALMESRARGDRFLIAVDSAIHPWAQRAGELFRVPVTTLAINQPADIVIETSSGKLSRDAAVVALADRVCAAFVRRGGNIEASLLSRLAMEPPSSTRVAVTGQPTCAANRLIAAGALGWYLPEADSQRDETQASIADEPWTQSAQWLIHCTRGTPFNGLDETVNQYRDGVLLNARATSGRGPLQTLIRILRSGRLVANSTATVQRYPVVCFSALPLQDLLSRRCFRSHLGRWDYEPFGIAIRRSTAERIGCRPVIYGDPSQRDQITEPDRFRFHPVGRTHDWTRESEWRSPKTIDLRELDPNDVRVFAAIAPSDVPKVLPPIAWKVTVSRGT